MEEESVSQWELLTHGLDRHVHPVFHASMVPVMVLAKAKSQERHVQWMTNATQDYSAL